jgi:phosphatidate phosphatase APP1
VKPEIQIENYLGYANTDSFYCYGRILQKRKINNSKLFKPLGNLLSNLRLLRSKEIANLKIRLDAKDYVKDLVTNEEAYFKLEDKLPKNWPQTPIDIVVDAKDIPANYEQNFERSALNLMQVNEAKAQFAVVSDVDDTILHTHVLSTLKLKLIYNSLLVSPKNRKAIHGTAAWYQSLHRKHNPVFYVSNSPWNFYGNINTFLHHNNFPEGPILLRDFGLNNRTDIQAFRLYLLEMAAKKMPSFISSLKKNILIV